MSFMPSRKCFVALSTIVALSLSLHGVVAMGQEEPDDIPGTTTDTDPVTYPENEEPDEVPGDNSVEAKQVSPARKQSLQRRAGEQVGNNPRGRAVILGMHLQEADSQRAKVVEVAPASPAFEAGIRKGDEIAAFSDFKATKYRDWIDGIRRMATDAPDGNAVSVLIVRGEKRLNARLRIPVSKAGVPRGEATLNQPVEAPEGVPSVNVIPGQPRPNVRGGRGGDVLIANDLGDNFNTPAGDNTGRAIAEIVRLNAPQQPEAVRGARNRAGAPQQQVNNPANPAASNTTDAGSDAPGIGARIGLAGFRNDPSGMFVLVDVGGLPAGNYAVGIDDPALLMSGGNTGGAVAPNEILNDPRSRTPSATRPNATPNRPQPAGGARGNDAAPAGDRATNGQQPPVPPPTDSAPQGRFDLPNRSVPIPRAVLAQVSESPGTADAAPTATPSTGETQPSAIPPTGNTDPIDAPPTGEVNPIDATPTGTPQVADGRQDPNEANNAPSAAGAIQIGTLTIDESGTGRLQQIVEAVQVQDIVGQAVVIYSQNGNPQATLPPNLDATADPLAGANATNARRAPGNASGQGRTAAVTTGRSGAANQPAVPGVAPGNSVAANGAGGNMPVAGGVIRLMEERSPDATSNSAVDQGLPNPQAPNDAQRVPQDVPTNTAPRAEQPNVR